MLACASYGQSSGRVISVNGDVLIIITIDPGYKYYQNAYIDVVTGYTTNEEYACTSFIIF